MSCLMHLVDAGVLCEKNEGGRKDFALFFFVSAKAPIARMSFI